MQPADYIAASNGDGEAVRAIVTTERTTGATTLIVDSVQNWPAKFIATSGTLDTVTGLLDEDTLTVFKGHLTGSIITIDEYAPGYSDLGHTVNQVVVLKPSTFWADLVKASIDSLQDSVDNIWQTIYPVGAIYISVVSTSPATLFGGTWTAFATGRTLVGIDTGQTEFDVVEETGGHKLLQAHVHQTADTGFWLTNSFPGGTDKPISYGMGSGTIINFNTGSTGGGNAQNLQPYIVTYMWKRTA